MFLGRLGFHLAYCAALSREKASANALVATVARAVAMSETLFFENLLLASPACAEIQSDL